jgi:hypothetical protein
MPMTPTHRPRRDYRTGKRLTMDATAIVLDLEDRLEQLREILRDLTGTLHAGQVRDARPWDGATDRRRTTDRRAA